MSHYHTPKAQADVLRILLLAQRFGQEMPTQRELALTRGVSHAAIQKTLGNLCRKGLIALKPYTPRGIEVLDGEAT